MQGYCIFGNAQRLGGAKRLISGRAHVERRKWSHEKSVEYCSKQRSRVEGNSTVCWGSPPAGQGTRSDLKEFGRLIAAGASEAEAFDSNPGGYIMYSRGIGSAVELVRSRGRRDVGSDPYVGLYIGPSGIGKSRYVYEKYPAPACYWLTVQQSGVQWWNGYIGQPTVVVDDFRGEVMYHTLLRWLDRYPVQVQTKGGMIPLLAVRWIFTSNTAPEQWYRWELENGMERLHKPALKRRINSIKIGKLVTNQLTKKEEVEWSELKW